MAPSKATGPASGGSGSFWPLGERLGQALELWQEPQAGPVTIGGLEGGARALALARLWRRRPVTTLVVCPTLAMAEGLVRDLEFFLAPGQDDGGPVRLFPAYEISPYREISPPPEVTARRLALLWELVAGEAPLLVVTSARGLAGRLCPPEYLLDNSLQIQAGQELARDALAAALAQGGYTPVPLVEQVGDFALRGSVVDFYGPLLDDPVRVEFFGDRVESLRRFDPADQRSQLSLTAANLIPCSPVDLSPAAVRRAQGAVRKLVAAEGLGTRTMSELTETMGQRAPFAGMEDYLPLYYPAAGDLFDYLPLHTRHVLVEPAELSERLASWAEELQAAFNEARGEGKVALAPQMLCRTPAQLEQRLAARPRLAFKALALTPGGDEAGALIPCRAAGHTGLHQELSRSGQGTLLDHFLAWVAQRRQEGRSVLLVCRSVSQLERLAQIFSERRVDCRSLAAAAEAPATGPPVFGLLVGRLSAGFSPDDLPLSLVTEDEVFGATRVVRQKAPPRLSAMLAALDDLHPGDLVVHLDHGVARYQGLVSLAVGATESDFLELRFAGQDKLYLPADRMGLISKYRGPDGANPGLDRLGSKTWLRTKARVKKAVEAIAHDLVELYAARSFQKGVSIGPPDAAFREFEATFPFQETPDQAQAIEDVLADLARARPMDRLVCGDVGFGKTEVALRAAFLVATSGRQVAILVPTTVLAEQHYQTFAARLAEQPLMVETLSRFKTPAQQRDILDRLSRGGVDILIGTHRLLQKDVRFADLGLVVLDEEQRFGVKHKEKLKKLRRLVDVLSLTATPIPRTLQMSLTGVRDLSIIGTPPEDRQSIKTYLGTFNAASVRQAIERELGRGGQVFYVHNRVHDIATSVRLVRRLVPGARVGLAHGQLGERALEKVMMAFVRRELDVLVCTTIIESGLDIPSANTIIIDQAEKLGLAQAYQLRGRVGRSEQRAYAYLFIKSETSLTSQAKKRLRALMDFTQLGAGFAIAMHDLEIRGAGNLLGEAQSGNVAEVGYELYVRMLEEAVARLKGEPPREGPEPELNLGLSALLPESYVPDPEVRLNLYKRLGGARQAEQLTAIAGELSDRFGPPPQPARNLLRSVELRNQLRRLRAERADFSPSRLLVHFSHQSALNLDRLLSLARSGQKGVKVFPDGRVSLAVRPEQSPFDQALDFLQYIGGHEN